MKKYITPLTLLLCSLMMASCIDEDNGPEDCPPDPEPERELRLELDWIESSPVSDEEYIEVAVTSSGGYSDRIVTDPVGRELDLEPGMYSFVGWEPAEDVTVSGRQVRVSLQSDGTAREPGNFSGGTVTDTVRDNILSQVISLPMRRQVRDLIIRINFTGVGAPYIEDITGEYRNMTVARDIDQAFPPANGEEMPGAAEAGRISYSFGLTDDNYWYQGSRSLLGVDGSRQQEIELRVMFHADNYTTIDLDVTQGMVGFHTENVTMPWYLDLYINVGAEFDMDIIDWISGSEMWLDAR